MSSGLRISQAADDAAGLAISEKMRAQIRGIQMAQKNIQDGISLVQVAEGGMAEIQNILQRARELSVQSANDTNTDEDRVAIQTEVTQLLNEIDGTAKKTEFNGMVLLAGNYSSDGTPGITGSLADYVESITDSNGINDTYTLDGIDYASAVIDFSNITSNDGALKLVGKGVHLTCTSCTQAYSIKFVDKTPDMSRLNEENPVMEIDIRMIESGNELVGRIIESAYGRDDFQFDPELARDSNGVFNIFNIWVQLPNNATNFARHFSQLAGDNGKLYLYEARNEQSRNTWPAFGMGFFSPSVFGVVEKVESTFLPLDIQAGSNQGQLIRLDIPNVTLRQLGIEHVSVLTQGAADIAISQIDHAISIVSRARASIGVYQNRLEYAFSNAAKYEESLTASESGIRDADISKEVTKFTNQHILLQSSQATTVQANQITQGILQLLK